MNRSPPSAKTAPAGTHVEGGAEITADEPERLLAWQFVSGSVDNIGTLTFDPAPADAAHC